MRVFLSHNSKEKPAVRAVCDWLKRNGVKNPWLDEDIQPLALTEKEIDDVVAFLASLTSDDYKTQGVKELACQRELSRTKRPQRDTVRAFGPKPVQPKPPAQ
jgi:cytochrome c peroxidase